MLKHHSYSLSLMAFLVYFSIVGDSIYLFIKCFFLDDFDPIFGGEIFEP